jgi:hypothetical protein
MQKPFEVVAGPSFMFFPFDAASSFIRGSERVPQQLVRARYALLHSCQCLQPARFRRRQRVLTALQAWPGRTMSPPPWNCRKFSPARNAPRTRWLVQSAAQLAAAGGRPIRWYFAEPETEAFAKELFKSAGGGRDRIETQVLTWPGSAP